MDKLPLLKNYFADKIALRPRYECGNSKYKRPHALRLAWGRLYRNGCYGWAVRQEIYTFKANLVRYREYCSLRLTG